MMKFDHRKKSQCENDGVAEPCHLKEDCDYRDIDSDEGSFCCESTDSEDSELDENHDNAKPPKQLSPGASITIEDSILSIMKYALRHLKFKNLEKKIMLNIEENTIIISRIVLNGTVISVIMEKIIH